MAPVENKPQAAAINPAEVLSNMMRFYRDGGRFCDVKIKIEDEVFELQRSFLAAISEYFDGMFRGDFEEGKHNYEDPIVLCDVVEASAFREIMNSVLTGVLKINDSNVYPLLRAADYLQIRGGLIEVRCYDYIMAEYSKRPLPCTFDILSFACLTEREMFIDLMIDHILVHMDHFAKFDARFKEIPFDIINTILLRFREGLDDDEIDVRLGNILFCSIMCWLNHSRAARHHHRRDLMKNINSSCISMDFALSLLNEHEIHVDEATIRGDNIAWFTCAYNPRSMLGVKFATGTTCELIVYDISELTVQDNKYRIRDLEWVVTVSHSSETSEYLSIHAHFEGDHRRTCDAEVSFIAVSENDGVEDVVKTFSGIFVQKQREGFTEFLRWNYFIDEKYGYIKGDDDDAVLQIRISF